MWAHLQLCYLQNREKKFSSGSNDSGCHSASGNLIRGAISDSSSGNEELDGSGNTNACAGCNLAAMARRARKPYDPDVVAGLVAMLKVMYGVQEAVCLVCAI